MHEEKNRPGVTNQTIKQMRAEIAQLQKRAAKHDKDHAEMGMGGVIAQVLTRAGVGAINILDKDHFEPSNNNRQVYANSQTWGRSKVEVTGAELRMVNPELDVRTFEAFSADNDDDED